MTPTGDQANLVAYFMLLAWGPLTAALFLRFQARMAATLSFLGAYLLLPSALVIRVAGAPDIDRGLVACVWALLGSVLFRRRELRLERLGRGLDLAVVILVISAFATALSNSDPIEHGPSALPGLTLYDGLSLAVREALYMGIPFVLGRMLFRRPPQLIVILRSLAVSAVLYSVLILYELRLSPTLHSSIYGYAQHSWATVIRASGWRPMVFMPHGLALTVFILTGTLAATGHTRIRSRLLGAPAPLVAAYLSMILIACKSLASIIYGLIAVPMALLVSPRRQLLLATLICGFVALYPILRATPAFPTQLLIQEAALFSKDRARSLEVRLSNEAALLERAQERIWFGWGSWGRNRLFDPTSGRDTSITDGYWIIRLGSHGIFGFTASFSLLLIPVFRTYARLPRFRRRDQHLLAVMAWIVTMTALDLIPNGYLSPFSVFAAGALYGSTSYRPLPGGVPLLGSRRTSFERPHTRAAVSEPC